MPTDAPQTAQDESPIYDRAFYDAIIAERVRLGANGFVDLAECMRVVGRDMTNVTLDEDNSHS